MGSENRTKSRSAMNKSALKIREWQEIGHLAAKTMPATVMLNIASQLAAAEIPCRPKNHHLWMGTN